MPGRPVQPVHRQVVLLRVPSGKHLPLLSTEAHFDAFVSLSVPPNLAPASYPLALLALTGVLLPVRIDFVQGVPRRLLLPRELGFVQSVPSRQILGVL